ncbi:hypothetical protein VTK26DRAFT_7390 [Humicola hyalothermophila]
MAATDPDNPGADADLNARFSELNMSAPAPVLDETSPDFSGVSDPNVPSAWDTQNHNTSLASQPAAPGYAHYSPQADTPHILAAQANNSTNPHGYSYEPADQAYCMWPPTTDTSSQTGPSSTPFPVATTTADQPPFVCEICNSSYNRRCDLTKHMNNHKRRRECDLCPAKKAETKDLNRHMWAKHPDEARRRGVPQEVDGCWCGYWGRKDNVKRHRDQQGH